MRSRSVILLAILILLTVSGCSRAALPATPNPEAVATQVNKLLTQIPATNSAPTSIPTLVIPTVTTIPSVIPTTTSAPTATDAATSTSEPTQSITPTAMASATQASTDPRTTMGTPTRSDTLDTAQFWGLFSDEHVKVEAGSGTLILTAFNPDGWHGWTLSSPALTNFYLEETAKPGDCSGSDAYGVMVRAPEANKGYFFGLSCDGRYSFQLWDGEVFTNLLKWTASDAIVKGANQTNRLGLMAKGDTFTLFANGVKLGEVIDSRYSTGIFGLWVASSATSNFTVTVDEVDYWNMP